MLDDPRSPFTDRGQLARERLRDLSRAGSAALHAPMTTAGYMAAAEQVLLDAGAQATTPTPPPDAQDTEYSWILLQAVAQQVTLTAAITASQTTIPVSAPATYPPFGTVILQIDNEQLSAQWPDGMDTTNWQVTRGANNTTPAPHNQGAAVLQIQIQVQSNALFPLSQDQNGNWSVPNPFNIQVEQDAPHVPEEMQVTACDQATGLIWTVTRAQNGTSATPHPNYAPFYQLKPGISTTLLVNIQPTDLVISVQDPANFPPFGRFYITIDRDSAQEERMMVIDGAGTPIWRVVRGLDGTSAQQHQSGATIYKITPQIVRQAGLTIYDQMDFIQPGVYPPTSTNRIAVHQEVSQIVMITDTNRTSKGYYPGVLMVRDIPNGKWLQVRKIWVLDINL